MQHVVLVSQVGSNLDPLHWECEVVATRSLGNSLYH